VTGHRSLRRLTPAISLRSLRRLTPAISLRWLRRLTPAISLRWLVSNTVAADFLPRVMETSQRLSEPVRTTPREQGVHCRGARVRNFRSEWLAIFGQLRTPICRILSCDLACDPPLGWVGAWSNRHSRSCGGCVRRGGGKKDAVCLFDGLWARSA
jgi:hypothetical protein